MNATADFSAQTILVTGGAGYIGSHTCVELLAAGATVVVIDNFCNASPGALRRVAQISGREVVLYRGDVRNMGLLDDIFTRHSIDSVIHFAGFKAVAESVAHPLDYYANNIDATLTLLRAMAAYAVKRLVFSSSATVYGDPESLPIRETQPTSATNPYGRTKLFIEQILQDVAASGGRWSIALLRYFNPVGAHPSALIGEDPRGVPNNLMPYISQVASGKLERLHVFGDDYDTPDGTGVRDYIHVVDLARGHLAALQRLTQVSGVNTWNLGTGQGYSVLELIRAFEQASGKKIPFQIAPRRSGDIACCYADVTRARTELGWSARCAIEQMCQDSWNWQQRNPSGYGAMANGSDAASAT